MVVELVVRGKNLGLPSDSSLSRVTCFHLLKLLSNNDPWSLKETDFSEQPINSILICMQLILRY